MHFAYDRPQQALIGRRHLLYPSASKGASVCCGAEANCSNLGANSRDLEECCSARSPRVADVRGRGQHVCAPMPQQHTLTIQKSVTNCYSCRARALLTSQASVSQSCVAHRTHAYGLCAQRKYTTMHVVVSTSSSDLVLAGLVASNGVRASVYARNCSPLSGTTAQCRAHPPCSRIRADASGQTSATGVDSVTYHLYNAHRIDRPLASCHSSSCSCSHHGSPCNQCGAWWCVLGSAAIKA